VLVRENLKNFQKIPVFRKLSLDFPDGRGRINLCVNRSFLRYGPRKVEKRLRVMEGRRCERFEVCVSTSCFSSDLPIFLSAA